MVPPLSRRLSGGLLSDVPAVRYRLRSLIRSGWRASVAIAVIVALTGGLTLALVAGALRTLSAPDRYVASLPSGLDAEIQQADGAPRIAELRRLPAVGHVETATFVFGGVQPGPGKAPTNLLVFAGSPLPVGGRVVLGRAPADDRPSELAVSRSFYESAKLALGSHLHLVTYTKAQAARSGFDAGTPRGLSLDVTLVGVLDSPAELSDNSGVALFSRSLLRAGDVGTKITVAAVELAPHATVSDLRSQVRRLPHHELFSVRAISPIDHAVRTAVAAQGQGLAVLAVIVAGTTIVVLGQLLSRQYRRSEPERMVLSSLGLTRAQLLAEPVGQAGAPVVLGAVAAALLAYACSGSFPRAFVRRIEPQPGPLLDPLVHVVGPAVLALAILGWMLCALVPRRDDDVPVRPPGLADRLAPSIPSATAALGVHFALGRGPARTRTSRVPLVALILISGLVFGALTFGRNLGLVIDRPIRYGVNYDVTLGQGGEVTRADVRPLLGRSQVSRDIAAITLYGSQKVDVEHAALDLIGMDPLRGRLVPAVLSGRLPAGADEIAIGRLTARQLHAGVGDTIRISTKRGPTKMQVTGTVQPPPIAGADVLGDAGVVTAQGYRRLSPGSHMDAAVIKLAPGAPAGARRRISEATGKRAGGPGDPPSAVVNLRRVRGIPFAVAALVALFATLSLGHQLLVAVRRRRRDLAILQALGVTRHGITRIVHVQATVLTAAVLVFAVPLGITAGLAIYRPFVDRVGARTDLTVPGAWVLAVAASLLVLANLIAAVPARRARRSSPSAALAAP